MPLTQDAKSAVADELQRIEEDCLHSGNTQFNAAGLRALATTNWVREALPARVPIHVGT